MEWSGDRYLAFLDVTSRVAAGGAGVWSFGGAQVTGGMGAAAGWSFVVVLEDPALAPARVAVFDGLESIGGQRPSASFSLPATPGGQAAVGAVVWDGDAGYAGDEVLVDGVPLVRSVSGLSDDVFASWADGAVPFCAPAGAPQCVAETNQLGFDTGVFDPVSVVGDRIRVAIASPDDGLVLGAVSLLTR